MNTEKIVNELYAAYGTDSGILFGIKEREVVKAIVEMTVRKVEQENEGKIKPTIKEAIKVITEAMEEDKEPGSYYHSWLCNIAMSFKDAYDIDPAISEMKDIHHIANEGAKNFLYLLCNAEDVEPAEGVGF